MQWWLAKNSARSRSITGSEHQTRYASPAKPFLRAFQKSSKSNCLPPPIFTLNPGLNHDDPLAPHYCCILTLKWPLQCGHVFLPALNELTRNPPPHKGQATTRSVDRSGPGCGAGRELDVSLPVCVDSSVAAGDGTLGGMSVLGVPWSAGGAVSELARTRAISGAGSRIVFSCPASRSIAIVSRYSFASPSIVHFASIPILSSISRISLIPTRKNSFRGFTLLT